MGLPSPSVLFQPVTCLPGWVAKYTAIPNTTISSGCSVGSNGNVNCDPAAMARTAGQKIGKPVSLEQYAIARYVTSEVGTRSVAERVAVAQAAVNRVKTERLGNVLNLLLYRQDPNGPYRANRGFFGPIHGEGLSAPYGRWASTSRDPALSNLIIAMDVLSGKIPRDFAKYADDQYGPEILVRTQGLATTQNGIRRRGSERKYWVGPLPGVDQMRTFLFTTRNDIDPTSEAGKALIERGVRAVEGRRPDWSALPACSDTSPLKGLAIGFAAIVALGGSWIAAKKLRRRFAAVA